MINSRSISELHPALQRGAYELISRMAKYNYPVGISSTYRSVCFQDSLFEQGRSKPGQIVTNARGGRSMHNYRLAFDIFKNIKGQEFSDARFFQLAGEIWMEMGGVWGGSWTIFVDRPHFEYTGGLSIADLLKGLRLPDDARMRWETVSNQQNQPEEEAEVRFNTVEELPSWGRGTVEMLIERGFLKGDGGGLDLSVDMLRLMVINDRAGVYGGSGVQGE